MRELSLVNVARYRINILIAVGAAHAGSSAHVGGTEPDMHLIKQVKQVARLALNRRPGISPGF
jgi:hypothetical protein